jgi:hypothetical protein
MLRSTKPVNPPLQSYGRSYLHTERVAIRRGRGLDASTVYPGQVVVLKMDQERHHDARDISLFTWLKISN